jgi:hypothetical protein
VVMPERPRRPDLDERFSLYPVDPEEGLKRLLESPGPTTHHPDEDEAPEDEAEEL